MVSPEWVLRARVGERVAALGLRSAHDYLELLDSHRGARELEALIELLRVGETSFFRHEAQVRALSETVIPELQERRKRGPIRAWSAGCASGEEAYTLAMVLSEAFPRPPYQLDILATDVSAQAIAAARAGEYPASAVAKVPERWRQRAFKAMSPDPGRSPETADRYRIAPRIADCIRFKRHNLVDGCYPTDIDIIWCRNVFIYFSTELRMEIAARLLRSLAPGGVLFVGYSESLRDVPGALAMRTPHGVVYRQRNADEALEPPRAAAPVRRSRRTTAVPTVPAGASGARTERPKTERPKTERPKPERPKPERARESVIALRGRYSDTERLASELSAAMDKDQKRVIVDMDGVEFIDDAAAPLLRRARNAARATGVELCLRTSRPGILRFLRRHGLAAPDEEGGR